MLAEYEIISCLMPTSQCATTINPNRAKVATTLIIQAKDYDYAKYYEAKAIIARAGLNRAILPCYVASVRDPCF